MHWNLLMRLWFTVKGLWDIVDGTEDRPQRDSNRYTRLQEDKFLKSLVDWDAQNAKAMLAIAESLTKEISRAIQTLKTANEIWSKLAGMFYRDLTMRAVTLLGQLFSIKFEARPLMQSFLMHAKVIHDQLLAMNSSLTSTQLAALVLTKLPEEYETVLRALRLQVTEEKLEFDDLSSFLIEEETKLISQGKV
ncbi:hypothetical protein L7F22_014163 [Adiantum nelumboides]|nr:hypothetical protein [Adiantum nelumboides]